MKYILAAKSQALSHHISLANHVTKGGQVVLNEKEVMCSPDLQEAETLEEKAALLSGTIYNSSAEILNIINS